MWGRIDAAERLLQLVDSMVGHRLSEAGTLEAHTRAVQAAVLRQELPTVLAEIESDARLGARSCDEAKAFCAAVRTMVGTPKGRSTSAALSQDQVEELLALQLVGEENLEMEVGSNLATMTSIGALATTAGVLRTQGPRALRGPARLLGTSSSVAWRIARRRRGRRLRALEWLAARDVRARARRHRRRPVLRRRSRRRGVTSRGRSSSSPRSWPSSPRPGCSSAWAAARWVGKHRTSRNRTEPLWSPDDTNHPPSRYRRLGRGPRRARRSVPVRRAVRRGRSVLSGCAGRGHRRSPR